MNTQHKATGIVALFLIVTLIFTTTGIPSASAEDGIIDIDLTQVSEGGTGYTWATDDGDGLLVITGTDTARTYRITTGGTETKRRIDIRGDYKLTVILDNLYIAKPTAENALRLADSADVDLILNNTNTLISDKTGLLVESSAKVMIIAGEGLATLNATGGANSAGIGGGWDINSGTITITGGIVTATGGGLGAGIGGGYGSNGGTVIITGGTVTANGGTGIGVGLRGDGGTVTISGSNTIVRAKGQSDFRDIGSGANNGSSVSLTIEDGAQVELLYGGTNANPLSLGQCRLSGSGGIHGTYSWLSVENGTAAFSGGSPLNSSWQTDTSSTPIRQIVREGTEIELSGSDDWVSEDVSMSGNTFTMPDKAVAIRGITAAQTPLIVTEPQDGSVYQNRSLSLSVQARAIDSGTLSYQWYSNTENSNSGGTAISGATDAGYSVPTDTMGTIYYYCVVTNTNSIFATDNTATATSRAAVVTVKALVNAETPVISSQPQDGAVNLGGSMTLTVSAGVSDGGTLSYQWYRNTENSNSGGTAISGATSASYSAYADNVGTLYYYCVITNTNDAAPDNKTAAVTSDAAAVTLNDTIDIDLTQVSENGTGYTWAADDVDGLLVITGTDTARTYRVTTGGTETNRRIDIRGDYKLTVILDNLNIVETSQANAFYLADSADADLILNNTNTLKGGNYNCGLRVESSAKVTIRAGEGSATLNATGGDSAAGIGGGYYGNAGNITIAGGNVTATGGSSGAGIFSSNITISGGDVTAAGGSSGAGIGSSNITISGGDVTATGGSDSTGIDGDTVTISGGTIIANGGNDRGAGIGGGNGTISISSGTVTATGGASGAGIGGGWSRDSGTITISGGDVTATGGSYGGAGIGSGIGGDGDTITISGGTIMANGGASGAGIGGGTGGNGGTVTINGGDVRATGGNYGGAGIGGGNRGNGGTTTISGSNTVVRATGQGGGYDIGSGASNTSGGSLTIKDGAQAELLHAGTNANPLSLGQCALLGSGAVVQNIDGTYSWMSVENGTAAPLGGSPWNSGWQTDTSSTPNRQIIRSGTEIELSGSDDWVSEDVSMSGNTFTMPDKAAAIRGITAAQPPRIITQPQNGSADQGRSLLLSVQARAIDSGTLSYQWYRNTENTNSGGTAISGATSASYSAPTDMVGTVYYYCVVTNTNSIFATDNTATAASRAATVTVEALVDAKTPVISGQPRGGAVNLGGSLTLTVTAGVGDGGALSYQWYRNTENSNSGGTAISDATNASYPAPTDMVGTVYYYCVVTNTNDAVTGDKTATVTSGAAAVTIKALVDAETPVISDQPQGGAVSIGGSFKLTVTAGVGDGGTLSYQWYRNTANSNVGGTEISGATSASYSATTDMVGTIYYYCVVTNTNDTVTGDKTATVTSNVAAVTVTQSDPGSINGIESGFTLLAGKYITFSVAGVGMDNMNPNEGDVRYIPVSWSVNPSGSWTEPPYTATFTISKAGDYTLSVVFNREVYTSGAWVAVGTTDTQSVSFEVAESDDVPQTGDSTLPLWPFAAGGLVALGIAVWLVTKLKKNRA